MSQVGTYASAICIIGILSLVWKENPYYRLMERLLVGLTVGQAVAAGYGVVRDSIIIPISKGSWSLIIPLCLGLMLYLRYFKQTAWLSKIPQALLVGIGLGLGAAAGISSEVITQIKATIVPVRNLSTAILVVGFLAAMSFFFFTLFTNHNSKSGALAGVRQYSMTFGRYFLMVFFGAQVGNAFAGRLSTLITKLQFLLGDVLGLIGKA